MHVKAKNKLFVMYTGKRQKWNFCRLSSALCTVQSKYLTIIGRGWAKYHDLSVASRSIIRLRQIIDLQDTDKSRYFAIIEFNNCFIIRSPRLFSYFNHFLAAQGSDLPFSPRERGSNYAWADGKERKKCVEW